MQHLQKHEGFRFWVRHQCTAPVRTHRAALATIVASPNALPSTKGNNFLTGITAISPTDVWAVGSTLDFTQGGLEQTMTLSVGRRDVERRGQPEP